MDPEVKRVIDFRRPGEALGGVLARCQNQQSVLDNLKNVFP